MPKLIALFVVLATLSTVHPVQAHFVWLERDGDGPARAYFGEWISDIREKSGGMLDRIKAPRVFLGAGTDTLAVKRNDNNLEIAVKGSGDLRLVDSSMAPREDKEKGGTTKTIYYARAGRSETTGKLDLEIVPVKANDNTFTILFAGSPLPKAEVTVAGPPRWEKRLTADDQGRIAVPTPWAGHYVLEVTYFDEKAGASGNDKFNRTRHISSLSFVQHDGIGWTDKLSENNPR
jgi:uncharacterized GH25 family protein